LFKKCIGEDKFGMILYIGNPLLGKGNENEIEGVKERRCKGEVHPQCSRNLICRTISDSRSFLI